MKKERIFQIILVTIFLVSALFLLQSASSLTANSSNYSVSMFGTGMATGTPSSSNYNSTFLSESKGTTRSAESSSLTGNIGFFENTSYYRTVSITSYSISPSSAYIGSTITFSISTINAQSTWARITLPDNTTTTLTLNNNGDTYYIPQSVGLYNVVFYANSSVGGLTSVIDSFEILSITTTPPSNGGGASGGGGTTTIIEKCTYSWDCTPWSVCSDGKQTRECKNIGTCEGNESKPTEKIACTEALFDISLKLKDTSLTENRTLKFNIDLQEKLSGERIDIHVKYSIINKDGYEIFSQIETKAVQQNLSYEKEIEEIRLVDGEYTLRVDILYGNLQRAFAEQKIIISNGEIETAFEEKAPIFGNIKNILNNTPFIILLIPVSIFLFLFLFRKDHTKERFGKIKRNKRKYLAFGFVALLIATLLMIIPKTNITGKIIEGISQYEQDISLILLIIYALILLIILRKRLDWVCKKIIEFLSRISNNNKKHPHNSIKGLVNKKVYSESGYYIGKIKDIILGENRIESLKIKIDKKHKFDTRGVIIDYKHIRGVSEIIIIDDIDIPVD